MDPKDGPLLASARRPRRREPLALCVFHQRGRERRERMFHVPSSPNPFFVLLPPAPSICPGRTVRVIGLTPTEGPASLCPLDLQGHSELAHSTKSDPTVAVPATYLTVWRFVTDMRAQICTYKNHAICRLFPCKMRTICRDHGEFFQNSDAVETQRRAAEQTNCLWA